VLCLKLQSDCLVSDMADFARLAAICVLGSVLAITVRKQSPELGLLTALAAGVLVLTGVLRYMGIVVRFWEDLVHGFDLPSDAAQPLLKTVSIAILTQISAQLCRDSGEGALAVKLELAGSAACIVLMLPMLSGVLSMIARLL